MKVSRLLRLLVLVGVELDLIGKIQSMNAGAYCVTRDILHAFRAPGIIFTNGAAAFDQSALCPPPSAE